MIKRQGNLLAYKIFVPSAKQNKVTEKQILNNLHNINYLYKKINI